MLYTKKEGRYIINLLPVLMNYINNNPDLQDEKSI